MSQEIFYCVRNPWTRQYYRRLYKRDATPALFSNYGSALRRARTLNSGKTSDYWIVDEVRMPGHEETR